MSLICPKCQSDINENEICICGFSTDILLKAENISKAFYNKGLSEAKNRNLSNAILYLRKSITFNNKNINARNLLGLVYFEMGKTTLAISQWVISNSLESDENIASRFLSKIESMPQKMESLYDSTKMYNQALTYIRQKSEDMAIIQLKKAIDLNRNSVDCYNLLALLYVHTSQNKLVMNNITKTLAIDKSNVFAGRYFIELNLKGIKLEPQAEKRMERSSGAYTPPQVQHSKSGFGVNVLIGLVIGVALAVGIMNFLVFPDQLNGKEKEIASLQSTLESTRLSLNEEILKQNSRILDMESTNETLLSENRALKIEKNNSDAKKVLESAAALTRDPIGAYTLLTDFKEIELDEDILAELNTAKENLKDKAGEAYFVEGRRLYNNYSYEEAKTNLSKSQELSSNTYTLSEGLYLLGRIAESEGNNAVAKEYYAKLINDYPNSSRRSTVQYRADRLN